MAQRPTIDRGISRAARESWSTGRGTPVVEQQLMGFYTGIVMDDTDEQRMGQVWVYIPGISARRIRKEDAVPTYGGTAPDRDNQGGQLRWDQELRLGWIQCTPIHPYFGGDDYRVLKSPEGDFRNAGNGDVMSYGFWAQPRNGDEVAVMFAHGDPMKAYWFGMVPKYARNFMVPGNPGRPPQDMDEKRDVQDELSQNNSIHKLTKQIKEEALMVEGRALVPVVDKARRYSNDAEYPVELEFQDVLVSPEAAQNVQKSGLLCDPLRGSGTSSARRESPSYVFGFKSAGWNYDAEKGNLNTAGGDRVQFNAISRLSQVNTAGHQFVMDDHPDHQGIRIRTSAGSQLYFHDTCNEPFIYITTAQGNVWIEIIDNGKINIHAEDSVSVHARNDINLTADRDLNIDVQRDLNVQVRRDTNLKMKGETHWELGKNDLPPQFLKYETNPDWGKNTSGTDTRDTWIQSFGNVDVTIGNSDNEIKLDPGPTVNVNLDRNLHFEVTQNVDWTIGNDLNIDVGNDTDMFIGANMRLETVDDIDFESGGNTSFEQQGTLDILTQGSGKWTASTHDHFSTGGDFVVTASPNIHLNGPQAATASNATNPNPVEPTTEPTIPPTTTTHNAPTADEIKFCREVDTDFRTLQRMTVPQHQPWPERCESTLGLRGFVDDAATTITRPGSTSINAVKPINLPEETRFREAQPFSGMNEAEAPEYDDVAPRGEFAPCSTYSVSDKGIDFLHRQEGFRTKAYRDADGYSIGYGHFIKVGDVINGDTINGRVTEADLTQLRRTNGQLNISPEEAERLFRQDLQQFEAAVCRQVTTNITQGQFDAMVSLAYNTGEGGLRSVVQRSNLNSGDFSQVPQQWMRKSTCSRCDPSERARVESVLKRRRKQELEQLFASV